MALMRQGGQGRANGASQSRAAASARAQAWRGAHDKERARSMARASVKGSTRSSLSMRRRLGVADARR